jgi:protein tyrosine/serine phosphatase
MYAGMLERGLPAVKTIFDLLANETAYPVVVHCAGGRDRTGVTIALLLRTLGVDDATIAADYALTDLAMPRMIERMKTGPWGDRIKTLNAADLTTRAESMIEFLQIVDTRFGGTTQVLYESGVPAETGERLRELLLERPAV